MSYHLPSAPELATDMPTRALLAALLVLAPALPVAARDPGSLDAAWRSRDAVAEAVVLVTYVLEKEGRGFAGVGQRADMTAVGTLVGSDGLVVLSSNIFPEDETESRTPARPHSFRVRLRDGRRLPAALLGRDRDAALAFLEVEDAEELPGVAIDEGAALEPGDDVLLVGLLPERYDHAPSFVPATVGAVMPGRRRLLDVDAFVQDSMIGTPVLDAAGRVAGLLLTDPLPASGAGEPAAPLKLIGAVTRLKRPGYPVLVPASALASLLAEPPRASDAVEHERSWLGVTLQPVSRALADYLGIRPPTGIMVTSVWRDSPAERAGLQVEDVVVRFDGQDVEAPTEDALGTFIELVQRAGIGREVDLVVHRGGRRHDVQVILAEAPTSSVRADEFRSIPFGLAAQDLTLDVLMGRGWSPDTTGALVSDVETAGWAQVGGLQVGDLVLAVGERRVLGIADLAERLAEAESERSPEVVFFVLRDPDTLFVSVRTDW